MQDLRLLTVAVFLKENSYIVPYPRNVQNGSSFLLTDRRHLD